MRKVFAIAISAFLVSINLATPASADYDLSVDVDYNTMLDAVDKTYDLFDCVSGQGIEVTMIIDAQVTGHTERVEYDFVTDPIGKGYASATYSKNPGGTWVSNENFVTHKTNAKVYYSNGLYTIDMPAQPIGKSTYGELLFSLDKSAGGVVTTDAPPTAGFDLRPSFVCDNLYAAWDMETLAVYAGGLDPTMANSGPTVTVNSLDSSKTDYEITMVDPSNDDTIYMRVTVDSNGYATGLFLDVNTQANVGQVTVQIPHYGTNFNAPAAPTTKVHTLVAVAKQEHVLIAKKKVQPLIASVKSAAYKASLKAKGKAKGVPTLAQMLAAAKTIVKKSSGVKVTSTKALLKLTATDAGATSSMCLYVKGQQIKDC